MYIRVVLTTMTKSLATTTAGEKSNENEKLCEMLKQAVVVAVFFAKEVALLV